MTSKPKRKSNRSGKKRTAFGEPATPAASTDSQPVTPVRSESRRWFLIGVFVLIAFGGTWLMQFLRDSTANANIDRYTYSVVKKHPHDATAFTQGLVLEDGIVWESTGKRGESTIRKYELGSAENIKKVALPDDHFGEGLAMVGDLLYQLTWQEGICHVYDRELNKVKEFQYDRRGWGLAYDGENLVMSDGSSKLYFIDPETFEDVRVVTVRSGYQQISDLNELEYSGGSIYANRLYWNSIYEIDPASGTVKAIIDFDGLYDAEDREDVLNGIAVDGSDGRVIVTGKNWPNIFEVKLKKVGQ